MFNSTEVRLNLFILLMRVPVFFCVKTRQNFAAYKTYCWTFCDQISMKSSIKHFYYAWIVAFAEPNFYQLNEMKKNEFKLASIKNRRSW